MKKVIRLNESDLTNIVKRVLSESDYSTDVERPTSDRERQAKSLFGDKYGSYIPNDVIRYIRKNPAQFFKKLYEMYGEAAYDYLDKAKERTNK
jgi:hypothetical protein|tara:strand:+ start:94 stop:372 length:279 start_codon:yes stop_codon:yes gene_type:complete